MSMQKLSVVLVLACWLTVPCLATEPGGYAVVVSKVTLDKPEWKKVVDALVVKHKGQVIVYEELAQVRAGLTKQAPRYACFVATSAETTRQFVAEVHRLTRQLDDDPYTDVLWGILTGYDAANAPAHPLKSRSRSSSHVSRRGPRSPWICARKAFGSRS